MVPQTKNDQKSKTFLDEKIENKLHRDRVSLFLKYFSRIVIRVVQNLSYKHNKKTIKTCSTINPVQNNRVHLCYAHSKTTLQILDTQQNTSKPHC